MDEKPYVEFEGKKYVRGMGMMPWPVGSRKRTKSEKVRPVFTKAFFKNPAAVALGSLGGKARAKSLSKEKLSEIGKKGVAARISKNKN